MIYSVLCFSPSCTGPFGPVVITQLQASRQSDVWQSDWQVADVDLGFTVPLCVLHE